MLATETMQVVPIIALSAGVSYIAGNYLSRFSGFKVK